MTIAAGRSIWCCGPRLTMGYSPRARVDPREGMREESPCLKLSFQWRFHEHPHPLRLLGWSHEWRELRPEYSVQSDEEIRADSLRVDLFYQAKWIELATVD